MTYLSWFSEQKDFLSESFIFEPRHEKTCLRGFRPGKTHTGLLSYRN